MEPFESSVLATNGVALPLRLEVDQISGDARFSIGQQTCFATEAGQYDEHGSLGGLRGRVDVILDQFQIYFKIESGRLKVVVVTGGYGRQDSYSISADEEVRLKTWISRLRLAS